MWQKVEYSDEHMNEMLEMTIENYGCEENISNHAFIQHEYFENPSGEPIISLAYDFENRKMAGQYVVIAQRMYVEGKIYSAILSLNTLTREEYRGQKVFISLAEDVYQKAMDNGVYFCYGAPNQNSHHGFTTKLQFEDIGIMPLYLKIVNGPKLIWEKLRGGIVAEEEPKNFVKKIKQNINNIVEITADNLDLMERFWNRAQGKYPVMVVRDASFFRWRYLEMPLRQYNIYAYFEEDEVQGYVVSRVTEVAGMRCGMIVDILFQTGRKDIGNQLIKFTSGIFRQKGVSLMGCLMQKHFEEADCLKRNGFFVCPKILEPQPFPIIFRKFTEKQVDGILTEFRNWYFTMGDYDVI